MNITHSVIPGSKNRLLIGKIFWKNVALPSILTGIAVIEWTQKEVEELQIKENCIWRQILGAQKYTPITVV